MEIIKSKRLRTGDTVGVISPSSYISEHLWPDCERATGALGALGLKVRMGAHAFDRHFYNAGTRDARLVDFHAMWRDPEVNMIMMSQGGDTANHLLDGIDYDMIRQNPKIFAGFSDGTTLVNAIFARTGLVTYYGPSFLWGFSDPMDEIFVENFRKTFFEGQVGPLTPNLHWRHTEKKELAYSGWHSVRSGRASGILMGGHSGCLVTTMLAGYAPDFQDAILFLEGTESIAKLDRQCTVLHLNGTFAKIKGLIIGYCDNHEMPKEQGENRPVADMVLEATRGYDFPILEISELGHKVENYTFPVGCRATMDADEKYLSIDDATVA
ncbi:MAG: LD-carboxypeptidase [Patescibacteria group bacterium]